MKILFLFTIISLSLFARINPFVSTETYEEQKTQMLKKLYEKEALEEAKKSLIAAEEKKKQEVLSSETKEETVEKKIYHKVKKGCQEKYQYTPLAFVKIETSIDTMKIYIDSKFRLLSQDILVENNKFVFDFKANLIFYTKREQLCHNYFKSFAIGNHPKEGYFRMVVALEEDIKNFEESVDTKNSIITIYRKAPAK
ncbi:MAG: hypothetical protein U9Q33_10680 [Campylobacterota bacterium]|nr:hypothetical protein [Campylobacterota bacterium]